MTTYGYARVVGVLQDSPGQIDQVTQFWHHQMPYLGQIARMQSWVVVHFLGFLPHTTHGLGTVLSNHGKMPLLPPNVCLVPTLLPFPF